MAGARWVQRDLLAKIPDANLRVYAVWFNMYPGDDRSEWPDGLLTDRRVIHFWDEPKRVGRFYLNHFDLEGYRAEALWDAYLLYAPEASWTHGPSPPISWGYTIVRKRENLERDLTLLLERLAKKQP